MTSAKAILLKTIPYILVKLALGGISVAASVIILALWIGFGIETGGFVSVLLFVLWMLVTTAVTYLLMHNAGYQIKAGHIAVAAEAAGANRVPYSMVSWGNRHVKELYPNRDSYFTMKRRVSRSIREVQSCFGRSDIRTASVTGTALTPLLTEPLLLRFMRYLDGCCIGWIFLRRKQNMYKSAADSVILYAKNRRVLLRNAIKVMLKSLICAGRCSAGHLPASGYHFQGKWSSHHVCPLDCGSVRLGRKIRRSGQLHHDPHHDQLHEIRPEHHPVHGHGRRILQDV